MARRQLPWSGIGSRRVAATVTPGNIGRREVTMRSCGTAPILAFANIPEPVSQDCRAGRHEPIVRSGPPPGTGKNAWTKRFKIQSGTIGQNVPAEVALAVGGTATAECRAVRYDGLWHGPSSPPHYFILAGRHAGGRGGGGRVPGRGGRNRLAPLHPAMDNDMGGGWRRWPRGTPWSLLPYPR